jgi:hypothetical protein
MLGQFSTAFVLSGTKSFGLDGTKRPTQDKACTARPVSNLGIELRKHGSTGEAMCHCNVCGRLYPGSWHYHGGLALHGVLPNLAGGE